METLADPTRKSNTWRSAACVALLSLPAVLLAGDAELPDDDFLEYLGSWEGSDEDWTLITDVQPEKTSQESDSPPLSEEPTESEDES